MSAPVAKAAVARSRTIVIFVGASGSGKSTLMKALSASRASLLIAPVLTTRGRRSDDDKQVVGDAEFARQLSERSGVMSYQCHGADYALALDELPVDATVMVSVPRGLIDQLRAKYERCIVIGLHAPTEVLIERVTQRDGAAPEPSRIAEMDGKSAWAMSDAVDLSIDMTGSLDAAVAKIISTVVRVAAI